MISDKQSHEVASRMREILRDNPHGWLDIMVGKAVVGVMGDGDKIGETVADLIDRPTCRNNGDRDDRGFLCSRCGYEAWTYDDSGCDPSDFSFCPDCGAEVVDDG